MGTDKTSFCAGKILINGKYFPFENGSAVEIKLSSLNLLFGDTLHIVIEHRKECKPKVLNPEKVCGPSHIDRHSDFRALNDSILTLSNSIPGKKYRLQQFKWNRWIGLDTLNAVSNSDSSNCSINIKKYLHSGTNQFRIKTLGSPETYSRTVAIKQKDEKDFMPFKSSSQTYYFTNPVEFKRATYYEVYDSYGNLVLKGYGKSFYINKLPKGLYYINYDNQTSELIFG